MKKLVYKILRVRDGLYKDNGFNDKFSKTGKIWKKLSHVRSHIEQNISYDYSDCRIYEFELIPTKLAWKVSK